MKTTDTHETRFLPIQLPIRPDYFYGGRLESVGRRYDTQQCDKQLDVCTHRARVERK